MSENRLQWLAPYRLKSGPTTRASELPKALEMGNSPQVVKDHYFEIVDEHDAKAYWSIKPLPRDDRKIVAIASQRPLPARSGSR